MPTSISLGQLEKVDIRDFWCNEAQDFTPWLAEERNIKLIGDTIGIDLEVESQEKEVGPFRADILCKDTATGHWVLIENQLDHDTMIKPTKPLPGKGMGISIGKAGFWLVAVVSTQDLESTTPDSHQLRVEFIMSDDQDKHLLAQLMDQKPAVEAEFGGPILWLETPGKKQNKVMVKKTVNLKDREQWPAYYTWLLQSLEKFHVMFAQRAKQFVTISSENDLC